MLKPTDDRLVFAKKVYRVEFHTWTDNGEFNGPWSRNVLANDKREAAKRLRESRDLPFNDIEIATVTFQCDVDVV